MQTQAAPTNTYSQRNTSATHRNNFNVSEVNYQHIARRPPVCAEYMTETMHNRVKTWELYMLLKYFYVGLFHCSGLLYHGTFLDRGTDPNGYERSSSFSCYSWGCCYQIFNSLKLFHFATDRNSTSCADW